MAELRRRTSFFELFDSQQRWGERAEQIPDRPDFVLDRLNCPRGMALGRIPCLTLEAARPHAELGDEAGEQTEGSERGERGVDDEVRGGIEIAIDASEQGGLAAAALAGAGGDAVAIDREAHTLVGLLEAGVLEDGRALGALRKRGTVQ